LAERINNESIKPKNSYVCYEHICLSITQRSISVYGYVDGEGVVLDERAPLGQNLYRWSYYSKAKVIAEEKVWDWHRRGKIKATVIRPSWLYGPRDRASIGRLIRAIQTGQAKLIGDGNNRLSLSYAGNVAEGAILAANKSEAIGEAYNNNSDGKITLSGYMNHIAKTLGMPPITRKVPYWLAKNAAFCLEAIGRLTGRKEPPMVSRYAVWLMGRRIFFSNEKIKRLGWKPTVDYDTGIPLTVKWYLEEHGENVS
jgi:nucleoside-diphosphate-sugar epimerase